MTIFREEPPMTEEDTKPFEPAYVMPPLNLRGLEMEYLYHPIERCVTAVFKGAASVALRQRGWKRITKAQYEANLP
jgi:hypothetical protein